MTGAGFGGNTVNVVEAGQAAAFPGALVEAYRARTGQTTVVRVVRPAGGVCVLRV